jgi:putative DNA primase/helicase
MNPLSIVKDTPAISSSANPLERGVEMLIALALREPGRYQPFLVQGLSQAVQDNLRGKHLMLVEYALVDFKAWGDLNANRMLDLVKVERETTEYTAFGEFFSDVRNLDIEFPPEPKDLVDQLAAAVEAMVDIRAGRSDRKNRLKDGQEGIAPTHGAAPVVVTAPEMEIITGLPPEVQEFHPTDLWNARLFTHLNKDGVRFCERLGGWHYFDGKRWTRSMCGEVERLAKDTSREILEMGKQESDDRLREQIIKHSLKTEAADKIAAMLKLASTEDGIVVPPEAFDADPWLFNAKNGTLDLRTGELRPHRPEDMLTNISPAKWRGIDAKAPRFQAFLAEAMDFDQEKYDFLQRAAGYTISGDMREQVFFFLHGPEAAGKGTFVRAIAGVMGTYSQSAEITTFLKIRNRSQVRNDIACLFGARLVTASEPGEGDYFDEELVKVLTGEDVTKARLLYHEGFDFTATFKLWFQGNHRPHIRSSLGAMGRRLLIVPFTKTVPEDRRDKTLGAILASAEERAGILAWMVQGCLDWQKEGHNPPDSVRAAVADYMVEEDRFAPYLEERTGRSDVGQVTKGDLYVDYKVWCEKNGEKPITKRMVGSRMEQLGFKVDDRIRGGIRVWKGIFLIDRGTG